MVASEAFLINELGKITIRNPIIQQAIEPELTVENKFIPAPKQKNAIEISSSESGQVDVVVHLSAAYGINIQEEAPKVQKKIKHSIETITGLSVGDVAVMIVDIFTNPEPMQAVAPKEEQEQ